MGPGSRFDLPGTNSAAALTPPPNSGKSAAVTIAPDITVKPDGASRRPLVVAALVIAAMTVMRIVYASAIELRTDEAYYWTWSKEAALCFLDHPPDDRLVHPFRHRDLRRHRCSASASPASSRCW